MSISSSDFYRRKVTQTDYRGGSSQKVSKHSALIDAEVSKLEIDKKKKEQMRNKVSDQTQKFLHKILPEDIVEKNKDGIFKRIFDLLGL